MIPFWLQASPRCPRIIGLLGSAALLAAPLAAQQGRADIGPSFRAYPAGLITTLDATFPLAERWRGIAGVGYNLTRRGDFGRHDDERGGGFGLGIGLDRLLGSGDAGWFVGGRLHWWRLGIDWRNDTAVPRSGHTDISVAQPTIRAGHQWDISGGRARFEVSAAFGAEVNVTTRGELVGEGAIGLIGASLRIRW